MAPVYLGNRERASRGFEPHQTPRTACNSPCEPSENLNLSKIPNLNPVVTLGSSYPHERRFAFGPSACPSCSRAQRYPSALPLAWPRALTRTIIARSYAQHRAARARGASPAAHAPRNRAWHARDKQHRWARTRASQSSGRTPATDIVRLIARYPPASLPIRRLHPETSRHRT